jgi:hypothetical protein
MNERASQAGIPVPAWALVILMGNTGLLALWELGLQGPWWWRALGGVSLLGSGLTVAAALRAIWRVVRRRHRHAPSA